MIYDKTSLVRQLVPTKYHFDAYNRVNCLNARDKPFFSDNVIDFDEMHHVTISLVKHDKIRLTFSSVCSHGKVLFPSYYMTLEDFVLKLQEAVKTGRDFIPLEISVNLTSYIHCNSCEDLNESCQELQKSHLKKVYAAVSFDFEQMKEALALYFEITNKPYNPSSKGGTNMKTNKFFGVNFEFGVSKDKNVASTLMGLAVKNTQNGNWYVFDPVNSTRKNLSNMKFGNFPVMLLPTREYVVGHLYKEYGEYYYVQSVNADKTVTLISATDGIIRQQIPEQGIIPGFDFHTEVIAFDAQNLMNGNSKESVGGNLLAAMLMMNWSKGNGAEFSLDSINDDSFNGLGQYLPLLLTTQNGNLGGMFSGDNSNLLTLMALGSGDGDGSDIVQLMVLSQLLSGGNNPFTGITTPSSAVAANVETKVICENCNTTYPDGTNFCPKCGGKTKAMVNTCRVCNGSLMEGAVFCHHCGAKVKADTCPKCGYVTEIDACFCSKCGTSLNSVATPVKETVNSTVAKEEPAKES